MVERFGPPTRAMAGLGARRRRRSPSLGSLIVFAWGRRIWRATSRHHPVRRGGGDRSHRDRPGASCASPSPALDNPPELVPSPRRWPSVIASLVVARLGLASAGLPLTLRLRSPIEVTWIASPREGTAQRRPSIKPPVMPAVSAMEPLAAIDRGPRAGGRSSDRRSGRPTGRARVRGSPSCGPRLADDARGALDLALAPGDRADLPAFLLFILAGPCTSGTPPFPAACNTIIALIAGVSVFGLENRRRTYRFLVHHGARPGLVWLAKLIGPGASAWR